MSNVNPLNENNMIKFIIKKDGTKEPFIARKVNNWGQWAGNDNVDWSTIVMDTVSVLAETITSTELQYALIDKCLEQQTWGYIMMAGRLYGPQLLKETYPEGIPTIRELHTRLIDLKLMEELGYSDEEYGRLEEVILHDRDYNTPHFSLKYIREKYAIQNRAIKTVYETQQFTYMRMAMAIASTEPVETRVESAIHFYQTFSLKLLSAPTPNFVNLGTPLRGFASCCLYTVGDTANSIGVGDWIGYRMTASSAGIGNNLKVRSLGDPVRGGAIVHNGKLPYYKSMAASVLANIQAGRGGACTTYYSAFDPEAEVISQLRNPRAPEDKRNRDLHYALMTNKFFANKVARNEDAFAFNPKTAPDLTKAFYSGDQTEFAELYAKYENDESFQKKYFSPRKLLVRVMNEAFETGVAYLAQMDEMNRHTPFNEPIHSSNLCVAPETMLLTDSGDLAIAPLKDQWVNVWNGVEWSNVQVRQTGTEVPLVKVGLSNGRKLDCTLDHKWYVLIDGVEVEYRTKELTIGLELIPYTNPNGILVDGVTIVAVIDEGRVDDTYCVTEPKRHMAVFNGILTGQCLEIAEPTSPYMAMSDLDATESIGHIEIKDTEGAHHLLDWNKRITINDSIGFAGRLKSGDRLVISDRSINTYTVDSIVSSKPEPEVAMCSIAAINVAEVTDDDNYEDTMYAALKMIDYCILNSHYELPHVGFTAKARMNAGVGIMGLATLMAREHLNYDSPEGKVRLHEIAERHMYMAIKASIRISKERGLAPWIHKTKWVNGWTPMQTYNKNVDELGNFVNKYDWDALSNEIRENGGIAHSCLVAYMPGESSSKALGQANSIYPIRELAMIKTDTSTTIEWIAPESDNPDYAYQSTWGIADVDQIDFYAIFQKWTDQAISADMWVEVLGEERVGSTVLIKQYLRIIKYGVKSRYYLNTQTSNYQGLVTATNINADNACAGGACTI